MPALDAIESTSVAPEVCDIIESAPLPGLGDQPKCSITRQAIDQWRQSSADAESLVESGLWLLAGELERSHEISQSYDSAEGSFWHGIMHRREGDFGNSKYWFRRVGSGHPVHRELAAIVEQQQATLPNASSAELTTPNSIALRLVDLVQDALHNNPRSQAALQQVCWWEWQLLFRHVATKNQTA